MRGGAERHTVDPVADTLLVANVDLKLDRHALRIAQAPMTFE